MDDIENQQDSFVVCEACMAENLTKSVGIASCNRCKKPYCVHFVSRIDPQYCVDCMSDMSVTKEVVSKTYEHYNEQTDTVTRYSRRAKQIKLAGDDWLFAQRQIPDYNDAELEIGTEYHRYMLQGMQLEAEERKVAKMHRYANIKAASAVSATTQSTTTVVKKTTKTSSSKSAAQLQALLGSMFAKGMKPEDIAALLKGK